MKFRPAHSIIRRIPVLILAAAITHLNVRAATFYVIRNQYAPCTGVDASQNIQTQCVDSITRFSALPMDWIVGATLYAGIVVAILVVTAFFAVGLLWTFVDTKSTKQDNRSCRDSNCPCANHADEVFSDKRSKWQRDERNMKSDESITTTSH